MPTEMETASPQTASSPSGSYPQTLTETTAAGMQTAESSAENSSDPTHAQHQVVWFVLHVLLAAFILFTNGLTLVIIGTTPNLQTQANMHVVSLTVADLFAGIFLLLEASWLMAGPGSLFDEVPTLCFLKYALLYTTLSACMLTMTAIAVDKLLYVASPFVHERHVTVWRTLVVIGLTWLLSLLYGSAVFYASVFHARTGCLWHAVLSPAFVFYANTTPVALAVFVIAGCYLEIVRVVAKQRRKIQALHQHLGRESYKKSLKLFLTALGLLALCWTPFVVDGFVRYVWGRTQGCQRGFLLQALLHCGLHLFTYCWQSRDWRLAYGRLVGGRARCLGKEEVL